MSGTLAPHILAANLSVVELGVVAAIQVRALDPEPRMPEWKALADRLGVSKQMVHKIKETLVETGRLIDAPWGLQLNPDPAAWVAPANRKAKATLGILNELDAALNRRPAVNPSNDRNGGAINPQVDSNGHQVNSQVDQKDTPVNLAVDSPRTAHREAPAGVSGLQGLIEGGDSQSLNPSEGECEGDDGHAWTVAQRAEIRGLVLGNFPKLGGRASEALAREVAAFAESVSFETLRTAVIWAAEEQPKGWMKSPRDVIRARATDWDIPGPPSEALAAVERYDAKHRRPGSVRSGFTPLRAEDLVRPKATAPTPEEAAAIAMRKRQFEANRAAAGLPPYGRPH